VRFVSYEPALGPVDFSPWLLEVGKPGICRDIDGNYWHDPGGCPLCLPKLDWVIVGGESGPDARPMHPDWARSVRDQCLQTRTKFFFKQWGEWAPIARTDGVQEPPFGDYDIETRLWFTKSGKKRAGRILDGRTWDELPEVAAHA